MLLVIFMCRNDCFNLLQVYKVLVRKTLDESWVVFRRYTDFSRLNDKVSERECSQHIPLQSPETPRAERK